MPILDPSHDGLHPVEGDSAWSESYYFNGYDPESDSGLYTRIGIRPNEGTMDVMLALWLPEGRIAFTRSKRDQNEICDSPLEVGGVRYVCVEQGKRWHLTARREARIFQVGSRKLENCETALDLEFEALLSPWLGGSGATA